MRPFECRQTAKQLDFYALDATGTLMRSKVRLTQVIGFGIENVPVFAGSGTFTRWQSWGYLITQERRYRVSVRLVRGWQRTWRWELIAKLVRVGIRRMGIGTVYRVVDWEYRMLTTHRRGGRWPRSRREAPEPDWSEAEVVLKWDRPPPPIQPPIEQTPVVPGP